MSIASRIGAIEDHIENAYQGLKNIGEEYSGNKNINNITDALNSVYDDTPKITATGTNFNISPTKKGKMELTLKGNTEQVSYEGKNLFNGTYQAATVGGNNNRTYQTTVVGSTAVIPCLPSTTYTIKKYETSNRFKIYDYPTQPVGGDSLNVLANSDSSDVLTITTNADANYLVIYVSSSSEQATPKMQIEEGSTATNYEPYVGGVPSPNPDYPQDIHIVTGNSTIKVDGKNLFNANGTSYVRNENNTVTVNDNEITLINTSQSGAGFAWWNIPVTAGQNYTVSYADLVENPESTNNHLSYGFNSAPITEYTSDFTDYTVYTKINKTNKVSTGTATDAYMTLVLRTTSSAQNTIKKIQVEQGSSATNYQPYIAPTDYPINLGSIELCKIGDAQDYIYKENDNWYKYNAVGKAVLDGSEAWSKSTSTNSDKFLLATQLYVNKNVSLCTHFKYAGSGDTPGTWRNNAGLQFVFVFSTYGTTTLEQWKEWLSTHNITTYQPLATSDTTQITDATLIAQLEAISNAMSSTGSTTISQTNADLPFVIQASALRGTPSGSINITQSGETDVTDYTTAVLTTETKTVKSTTSTQTINPTSGKFIRQITVNPISLETKSVTPSTSAQTITPTSGKDGISQVNVSAVDSSIDSNIQAANIKDGVTILGIQGTYSGGGSITEVVLPDGIKFRTSDSTNMNWLSDVDISNITNMSNMFRQCANLSTIPQLNTSNVTSMDYMFYQCTNLSTIPQLDTSNVTNMNYMFYGCSSLSSIPLIDTSNVTNMGTTFAGCSNLSNTSLNNILQMCINATKITSTSLKTLARIGLTSAQATTCQSLSNWNDFVAAGWSSGY